jgi:hypothetical protein
MGRENLSRQNMSRDEYRAWKDERKAEWRARKAEWRANGWRPGYGWSPFNIAAMVIGFIVFAPVGLAILFWNIWTARRQRAEFAFAGMGNVASWNAAPWSQTSRDLSRNSGNAVFEDYKKATLERLEEERRRLVAEQEAFASFLDDLKRAKDRTEFERFMQERETAREASREADNATAQPHGPADDADATDPRTPKA